MANEEFTRTEICRRLHDMVDSLMEMPDAMWDGCWPTLRVGYRRTSGGDPITLVVGVEIGNDE